MKNVSLIIIISLCIIFLSCNITQVSISIVVPDDSGNIEKLAAKELQTYLSKIYPDYSFEISHHASQDNQSILIGTVEHLDLPNTLLDSVPENPEGFLVTSINREDVETGVITSHSSAGLIYGVYQLLEKLGCGFYLSKDTYPIKRNDFDFKSWSLSNFPLVPIRIVNNWGGAPTGSTVFNLEDWKSYIEQSQKMGYNTLMVHGYANDPIFTFSFNGEEKPVSRVPSTIRGRNWGTEHYNDVRRLPGGFVFDGPVHGSKAAKIIGNYIEAQQSLMKQVFAYTKERGMKANFMLDIDTYSAMPQNVIKTLPDSTRFYVDGIWYPKLDEPEVYNYFKAQIQSLYQLYPHIDVILTMRGGGGLWGKLKPDDLPESMRSVFKTFINSNSDALGLELGSEADVNINTENAKEKKIKSIAGRYVCRLVHELYLRAINEVTNNKANIAIASWRSNWIPITVACESETTKKLPLIPFDWNTRFDNSFLLDKNIEEITPAAGRMIPMIWPRHDDGRFLGPPLKAFENFADLLYSRGCIGFGVLHWFERPDDLYFKNHIRQVWSHSRNESEDTTRFYMAQNWFGKKNARSMANYLKQWQDNTPQFARLHGSNTYYAPWKEGVPEPDSMIIESQKRLTFLNKIDTNTLTDMQRSSLSYFQAMEEFLIIYGQVEINYQKANTYLKTNQWDEAKKILTLCKTEDVIKSWAHMSQLDGESLPEKTYILQMYSHWHCVKLAGLQKVGLEAIRINFNHSFIESANIGNGFNMSYFLDRDSIPWAISGNNETNLEVVDIPSGKYSEGSIPEIDPDVFKSAVRIDISGIVPLRLLHNYKGGWKAPGQTRPGTYSCRLWVSCENDNSTLEVSNNYSKTPEKVAVPSGRILEIKTTLDFPKPFNVDEPIILLVDGGHILVYGMELSYLKGI